LLIGNTSALEDHKDYFTFIDTVALLKNGIDFKAFVIGDGSLTDELKKYASEKGVSAHIIFTGFRKDILKVLPALDIFLMTSKEEGLGTSILDAFAANVPVVATRAGGIPEMVLHEETGLLANIGDAKTLSDHIVSISSNASLRLTLINGATLKLDEFSKEKTAALTLAHYQEILQRH
jgi:L-malate glycosyltransferase